MYTNVCRDAGSLLICLHIWSGGMPVLLASPLSDVILAQLACHLSDIIFRLHSGITNLSLQTLVYSTISIKTTDCLLPDWVT